MRKSLLLAVVFAVSINLYAQELDCQVIVNSDLVDQTNQQIFKTLERAINEFLNTQTWTDKESLNQEKITCSFVFTLTGYSGNLLEGTLQVQSQRPVFESDYDSPIVNYLDKDIVFSYQEFQPLFYTPSAFESNLVSLLSFYAYLIIGLDADSFKANGGSEYFNQAQQIADLARQNEQKGWNPSEGNSNRRQIIDNVSSNAYREYRQAIYNYHRKGLDNMSDDPLKGKQEIMKAIKQLEGLHKRRPNAIVLRMFFDAKVEEIVSVLSGGPEVEVQPVVNILKKIAPFFGTSWKQIQKK